MSNFTELLGVMSQKMELFNMYFAGKFATSDLCNETVNRETLGMVTVFIYFENAYSF
jgi:hypothetical protein